MKKILFIATLCALTFIGCKNIEPTPKRDMAVVMVGIGNYCDKEDIRKKGAYFDLDTMSEIFGRYFGSFPTYYILKDNVATTGAVKRSMISAIQHELAVIYFTCKATQIQTDDPSEPDGLDEALCLYDGKLIDNEIWEILQYAKGDVFIIFDTGHSATMFKATNNSLNADYTWTDDVKTEDTINLLCWSACGDDEEIRESEIGSKLTNALYFKVDQFDTYKTAYDKVFKSVSKKKAMSKFMCGKSFEDNSIFR